MIIIKLGGTSVSNVDFIAEITKRIVDENDSVIVVLSALSQVTNTLEILQTESDAKQQLVLIDKIKKTHLEYINKLFSTSSEHNIAVRILNKILYQLKQVLCQNKTHLLLAFGEYLSTSFFSLYLRSLKIDHDLKNSTQYLKLNKNGEPDIEYIKQKCNLTEWNLINVFQGFICSNVNNEIATLSRGGSDFTATLLGEAVLAKRIEIWTDIDGIRSNDPRYVENTKCVTQLNYMEAAELAYFGAKILHPESVLPAQRVNVPIILKNAKNSSHKGTTINNQNSSSVIKAIAAKEEVILINITSYRMLMAHGFLSKIFNVFSKYKTAIDLITTSEVSVSLTIDDDTYLDEIIRELKVFAEITTKDKMAIISVVGNFGTARKSIASQILSSISNPIEIMSYGNNRRNISALVNQEYKSKNLNELNELSFN